MIRIKNLHLHLGERQVDLKGELIFPKGSITLVKGASGSGKTALLYILGLISKQDDYQYLYQGQLISQKKIKDEIRKNEIGMLYQNFNMHDDLSLWDNLKLFAYINDCEIDENKAQGLLERLNIHVPLDRLFASLSGGEKQRFSLACILVKDPKVIILDEPTSALDKSNADLLMDCLEDICHQENKTMIVSTHSHDYDDLADSMIEITENQIIQTEVFGEEASLNLVKRPLNPRFYTSMTIHWLKKLLRKNLGVMLFTILALTLSSLLFTYSKVSVMQYTSYLDQSMNNEIFLCRPNFFVDDSLSEEEISYIESISGVKSIHEIEGVDGILKLPSGEVIEEVPVFGLEDFQKIFDENKCASNSILRDFKNHQIMIDLGNGEKELELVDIFTPNRAYIYSNIPSPMIFVDKALFKDVETSTHGDYVIEIASFDQYELVSKKIENVFLGRYHLESAYEHATLLLHRASQHQNVMYMSSILLLVIGFFLFAVVEYHEVTSRQKEFCIYQANGLNQKHILALEMMQSLIQYLLFLLCAGLLSYLLMMLGNHYLLDDIKMIFDSHYLLLLALITFAYILLPSLLCAYVILKQDCEEILRSIF